MKVTLSNHLVNIVSEAREQDWRKYAAAIVKKTTHKTANGTREWGTLKSLIETLKTYSWQSRDGSPTVG